MSYNNTTSNKTTRNTTNKKKKKYVRDKTVRKRAVKRLATSSISANIGKYAVMVFSIVLTTVLFSSLFTIVGSILSELTQSSMGEYNYLDPVAMMVCAIATLIFMISGYLIIYNIFDLNIISDMKEFGLLKTIGTSEKQIRTMIKMRSRRLSLIAIPIGLAIGCGIAGWFLPTIGNFINTTGVDKGQVHMNIWIIIVTVIFAYMTVAISARKPCRKASKMSPVEASRFTGFLRKNGKPRKKTFVVVMSLTLSFVLLNSAYTIMDSFNLEESAENFVVSDFCVQDSLLDNAGASDKNLSAVGEDFFAELAKQDGVEGVGNMYVTYENHKFSPEVWDEIEDYFFSDEVVKMTIESFYTDEGYSVNNYLSEMRSSRSIEGNTYGMGKLAVEKLEDVQTMDGGDSIDWNKFNSGKYVIAERWQYASDGFLSIVCPGDKVEIGGREYTVYASVDIPMEVEYPVYKAIECNFILPEDEYLKIYGKCDPMRTLIDVEDDKETAFESWISSYLKGSNLNYTSKQSVIEDNKAFGNLFALGGIFVAVILGIIGVMNFANTMIASIIARNRELAMLEAVGMTPKQQKHSLMKEGFRYFAITSVLTVILSTIASVTGVHTFIENLPMFSWNFSLTALAVVLPVVGLMVMIVPALAYNKISKKTVVERLRVE